jgi:hypothetical protein
LPFSIVSSFRGTWVLNDADGGGWFCSVPQVDATRFDDAAPES